MGEKGTSRSTYWDRQNQRALEAADALARACVVPQRTIDKIIDICRICGEYASEGKPVKHAIDCEVAILVKAREGRDG